MAGYIGSQTPVVSNGSQRKYTFTATAAQTVFTGMDIPNPQQIQVFQNGVRLVITTDYTVSSGTTVTLVNAASAGDSLVVILFADYQLLDTDALTFTGGTTIEGDLTVDTNTLYVDSTNNNVGIGTSSPDAKLDVSRTGNGQIAVLQTSANRGFSFESQSDTALQIASVQGSTNLDLWANTLTFSAGASERMRIDSSGNVGIGTSLPTSELTIGSDTPQIDLYKTSSADVLANIRAETDAGSGGKLVFQTKRNGDSALDRMTIDDDGNLLVAASSVPSSSVAGCRFNDPNAAAPTISRGSGTTEISMLTFQNGNGTVGQITTNGSATAYLTSSDYRLKEDWQPMTGASDRVLALNPVNFAWKADGTRVDGFLAHEAQAVVPEAVTGTHNEVDDDGNAVMQGIDQSKLVPLLTAALKEAITKIETLETEMTSVKARLDALEGN